MILKKWLACSSKLNYIGGKITKDGILLLVEGKVREIDYFQRPVPKNDWTIRVIKNSSVKTIELKDVSLIPTEVDLFSDGTLLIVQSRCLKKGKYIEKNAQRYHPNGQLVKEFSLGDGIENVQIDDTDTIWVSYFDEGIFGNFGWEHPMGSDGLIAYNINGNRLWGANNYGIVDCYALNVVSSKEIYFYYYYYDDFFLIQLNKIEETNRYRVKGDNSIQQFMFDESGMIGQIETNTIMRFQIKKQTIISKEKIRLTDENGKSIIGPIFMRGSFLYVYGKDGIYVKPVKN